MLQNRPVFLSAATIGGALIGLALEKYGQGSANITNRYLRAAALGGLMGASGGAALVLGTEASQASGKANWGVILGSAGASATLLYQLINKNYNYATVIRNTAIVSVAAGAAGTAITHYQRTQ